jgi:putative transposase
MVEYSESSQNLIIAALCAMFSKEILIRIAKETGLIKRERIISPVIIFWVLTLSFGVRLQRSLASMKREYEQQSGNTLADSSWYCRFTPELSAFLKACVIHGLEQLAKEQHNNLNKKLIKFKDVLIQDSTIVRLHSSLSKLYPATRSNGNAAGVKLSFLISAVSNGPNSVRYYPESTSEMKTMYIGPWIKDKILLIDLGFFKYQLFTRIIENGGHFVSRLKDNANPIIISANRSWPGRSIDVTGKHLKEVLPKISRQILDVEVEVSFRRREYKGKCRSDTNRFRLVAVYNEEDEKYHSYLTDINSDILSAEDVAKLYGARWDIELLFKELKSRYALDVINTKNPNIIEGLLWVAILTLLISRRLHSLIRKANPGKNPVRFTQLRWSTIFAENASDLLTAILEYQGFNRTPLTLFEVYSCHAFDPHVKRDRFRAEWWT